MTKHHSLASQTAASAGATKEKPETRSTTPAATNSPAKITSASAVVKNRYIPGWLRLLYIPLVVTLSVIYFLGLRSGSGKQITITWLLIGCSGIATMLAGLLYYRPTKKSPWWFFIAANICFIGGDTFYNTIAYIQNKPDPYPSLGDVMYLATYPLFAIGMYLLIRQRSPKRTDKGSLLDALTITVSLALILWVYLIVPTLHAEGTALSRAVSIAYPLGDVLVWALLIRLLTVDYRTPAVRLLTLGAVGLIGSDVVYSLSQLNGSWQNTYIDVGWIVFYTAWGAAALSPSMLRLSQPLSDEALRVRAHRLVILSLAALVAPLILIIKAGQGEAAQFAGSVAGFAAVLFVLVILRLYTLTREVGRQEAELRLNQEKNELLAISSHQLRTPLTTIKVYTEMLATAKIQNDPAQVAKYTQVIGKANDYMVDIVNNLIYTAQLDMGEVQFNREPVPITTIIDQALKDTQALSGEQDKLPVRIVNKLPASLAVQTDSKALVTILTGVLTNAVQYRTETDPTITISATADSQAKTATIHIADNGNGIPAADQPKVFGKLFRASNARTMSPDGSGLSLYMARSALRYLDGDINLESTEGVGTTAHITLPTA